jgi:hypothetical protein
MAVGAIEVLWKTVGPIEQEYNGRLFAKYGFSFFILAYA